MEESSGRDSMSLPKCEVSSVTCEREEKKRREEKRREEKRREEKRREEKRREEKRREDAIFMTSVLGDEELESSKSR
ncbi:hypothetical protein TURU_166741 [Turdus rufiventris]|nr:hypothetical protein TURU_166741 [Turdus rufiventris]